MTHSHGRWCLLGFVLGVALAIFVNGNPLVVKRVAPAESLHMSDSP